MSGVQDVWAAIHRGDVAAAVTGYRALSAAERQQLESLEVLASDIDGAEADALVARMVQLHRDGGLGEGQS